VHAAFVGSLVYAALSLTMIVVSVRPWTWFRRPPVAPTPEPVAVDSHI
jgi:hypothetical protein